MIAEHLGTGKDYAKTGRQLAKELHTDIRTVCAKIEIERRNGKPILAETRGKHPGYYLSDDPAEIQRYCDSIGRRASNLHETRSALLETGRIMKANKPRETA